MGFLSGDGETTALSFLVKCWCHVDPCAFSHGRRRLLSPCTEDASCECLVNRGLWHGGPSLTFSRFFFFRDIAAVKIVCVGVHFCVCVCVCGCYVNFQHCTYRGLELNNVR